MYEALKITNAPRPPLKLRGGEKKGQLSVAQLQIDAFSVLSKFFKTVPVTSFPPLKVRGGRGSYGSQVGNQ